jgi:hypothetical protein
MQNNRFDLAFFLSNSIKLNSFDDMPESQGLYLVGHNKTDGFNPMYLGMSINLKERWRKHHRMAGLKYLDRNNIPVSVYVISEQIWIELGLTLAELERKFIYEIKPTMNGQSVLIDSADDDDLFEDPGNDFISQSTSVSPKGSKAIRLLFSDEEWQWIAEEQQNQRSRNVGDTIVHMVLDYKNNHSFDTSNENCVDDSKANDINSDSNSQDELIEFLKAQNKTYEQMIFNLIDKSGNPTN